MTERTDLIDWTRGELIGPSRPLKSPAIIEFSGREFTDNTASRTGAAAWRPSSDIPVQEVLYFDRESPHRKYGAGLLHPAGIGVGLSPEELARVSSDTLGVDSDSTDFETGAALEEASEKSTGAYDATADDSSDDFEVTGADVRNPSTLGVSACVTLEEHGQIVVQLPQAWRFAWQESDADPFQVNGRYEQCKRRWTDDQGQPRDTTVWRRHPAVGTNLSVAIRRTELISRRVISRDLALPNDSPVRLRVELYPRRMADRPDTWLITIVLRNTTKIPEDRAREAVLYQVFFDIRVQRGCFTPYPESLRPFSRLDDDEQSLALLYRDSSTWAIGHGCAAGWDTAPGTAPEAIYADVMPAVELPSMTPDIEVGGKPLSLSMRSLARISDDGSGDAWNSIDSVLQGYSGWIADRRRDAKQMPPHLFDVASRHLDACQACLDRMHRGAALLRADVAIRNAFALSNLAMLLQQIASKQIARRPLEWDSAKRLVVPKGPFASPWDIYVTASEERPRIGTWRAFQIAFFLMSLDGICNEASPDRDIVDLIWFPTGGGKTEAYLAVLSCYMFHQRLQGADQMPLRRDGTNVLMRYTLRMLTTQQFQRGASLVCAMEYIRRNCERLGLPHVNGRRFSLGLWLGSAGSPNTIAEARTQLGAFRRGDTSGNPLVLTECPWCRAAIGRFDGAKPTSINKTAWNAIATRGVADDKSEGPLLYCPDSHCDYGREDFRGWLPVEVIDERIYRHPPSLVIGTVDKLAMVAYRPSAGALFGRTLVEGQIRQTAVPPGLIIQDELHLISGPLGSMYALYEGIIEELCTSRTGGTNLKPKIVASTATIRGASTQVRTLYARATTHLFPSPGLEMGDSFFGRYARDAQRKLLPGRMYLGIHATDYGSVLTTQVRSFSSLLFRPWSFPPSSRDAWWTLLAFYNSIRELGGAKTLFDSDIRSRLKFMFNREGSAPDNRRTLRIVEELTSRLSQAEIVGMMDLLSSCYNEATPYGNVDACLASNIIEVGVDIDRLSVMGVVGQPKTTASYIQVTGRVGRQWWSRPGLIAVIYNPGKSRDRSHFEQFYSYHRRLYERVEPTSATPFAISAIHRGLAGALLAWARQHANAQVSDYGAYSAFVTAATDLLRRRCKEVQLPADQTRSLAALELVRNELLNKWQLNPQAWEEFPRKSPVNT